MKTIKEFIESISGIVTFQAEPTDLFFNVTKNSIERAINNMEPLFRDGLIGLKEGHFSWHIIPVFNPEVQKEWDKRLNLYLHNKAKALSK